MWGRRLLRKGSPTMTLKYPCVAIPAVLLALVNTAANAGETIDQAGTIVCVNDKWDEKEPEKGHKLVDLVQRCASVPNDPAQPKFVQDCVGKYECMPDKSWKASGTCTDNIGKERRYETWEEGSHLKEYSWKITGGTGKYEGASGWRHLHVREPIGHHHRRNVQGADRYCPTSVLRRPRNRESGSDRFSVRHAGRSQKHLIPKASDSAFA